MEYQDNKTSVDTQDKKTTLKTCDCNLDEYYCFCNGENALLDELKEIGVDNLKLHIFHYAAKYGHLNILKYLQFKNPLRLNTYVCTFICMNATYNGHLGVLKWLMEIIAPIDYVDSEMNIHCLEYLFEINKTEIVANKTNLQQIERLKILASGVF